MRSFTLLLHTEARGACDPVSSMGELFNRSPDAQLGLLLFESTAIGVSKGLITVH